MNENNTVAIKKIIDELLYDNKEHHISEIKKYIYQKGIKVNSNSINNALATMFKDGAVIRPRRGVYLNKTNTIAEQATPNVLKESLPALSDYLSETIKIASYDMSVDEFALQKTMYELNEKIKLILNLMNQPQKNKSQKTMSFDEHMKEAKAINNIINSTNDVLDDSLDEDFIADDIPDDNDSLLKYDDFENDTLK